ncbi:MAG: HAMP domain-containing sensor histidine kinase [Pseudomonadota bacterium]
MPNPGLLTSSSVRLSLLLTLIIWLIAAVCIGGTVTLYERALLSPLSENVSELGDILIEQSRSDSFEAFEWYFDLLRVEPLQVDVSAEDEFPTFLTSYLDAAHQQSDAFSELRLWLLRARDTQPDAQWPLDFYRQLLMHEVPARFHSQLEQLPVRSSHDSNSPNWWEYMRSSTRLDHLIRLLSIDQQREGRCVRSLPTRDATWSKTSVSAGDGFAAVALTGEGSWPDRERLCWAREFADQQGQGFQIGVIATETLEIVHANRRWRNLGLALSLALALLAGFILGQRVYARLRTINALTERVRAGEFQHRLRISGKGDDFDQLSKNINAMLDQILQLMDGIRQVSDNIAHDLRSPLTRLRNRIEKLQLVATPDPKEVQALADQADQVLKIFSSLLRIAQLEQGIQRQQFARFDLAALLQEVFDLYEPVFQSQDIDLELSLSPDALPLYGDRSLWVQAMTNLLENALRYAAESARVIITLDVLNGWAEITVQDQGPGVPEHSLEKLTERFFRGEEHRQSEGTGLGLSLVAAICGLHDAELKFSNDGGFRVCIRIATEDQSCSEA